MWMVIPRLVTYDERIDLGVALFTGNVINKMIIYKIHTRENYKGITAAIIPFVCVIAVTL